MMTQVHAPYHFVPLSEWIYMPDWAHLVSHDVPFKDGYSGKIEFTLTNHTALLVGGKRLVAKGQPTQVVWATDPNGKPVIPGSSLKGLIRNVLEIATFGQFSAIDESQFSYRDIAGGSKYLEEVTKTNEVVAGWLKFDHAKARWQLSRCQHAKVKHSELNANYGVKIVNKDLAVRKYQQFGLSQKICFELLGKGDKVKFNTGPIKGDKTGHMVFCNHRIKGKGAESDYDFSYVFYGEKVEIGIENDRLTDKVQNFIASHDQKHIEYLLANQHPTNGMPVFILLDKTDKKLHSLGLAKMPRILYKHSAAALANAQQTSRRISPLYFDMAELMFGTLREKGLGLKSRVVFSDGILQGDAKKSWSDPVILNGPKATFVATYLEQLQTAKRVYQDYNDSNNKLAGWKRYFVQNKFNVGVAEANPRQAKDNNDVKSQLELLDPQHAFTGTIVFNNLKTEELGALLWALQLGKQDSSEVHYHSLGHGKSLGAGAVKFTEIKLAAKANDPKKTTGASQPLADDLFINSCFIDPFIAHMNERYQQTAAHGWENSPQIRHLLAMANPAVGAQRDLSYMPLGDHQKVKNVKLSLPPIKVAGIDLERTDKNIEMSRGLSFDRGRLAELSKDIAGAEPPWYKEEKAEQGTLVAKRQAAEEARLRAAEEARLQAAEEVRLRAAEEARLRAAEEARLRAAEEARLRAAEEAQRQKWFESLSAPERTFYELKDKLERLVDGRSSGTKEYRQSHNTTIEKLLDDCLANEVSGLFLQAFYDLCTDKQRSAYLDLDKRKNRNTREKLATREKKLADFAEKYHLITVSPDPSHHQ